MTITFKSSVIFVKDMLASRQFYEGLLGQVVEMDFGVNVGYKNGFALWQINAVNDVIFGMETELDTVQLGQRNFELYFETDDLPDMFAALEAANVPVVHPLREQPWGQRALRVFDPDGHIIEISEPMDQVITRLLAEGASVESVAQRSAMPLELVQYVAEHGTFPPVN